MKLTIITPAYNVTQYIGDLFEKVLVLKKTIKNLNWIIVNDGSTDNIKQVHKSWNKGWIKLINKKNGGLGSARTAGMNEAIKMKSEYIWHMDADDYMVNEHDESILKQLNGKNEIIKLGDLLLDDKTGQIKNDKIYTKNNFLKNWQVWPQGLIIKTSAIPKDFQYYPKNGDIANLLIFDKVNEANISVIEEYISVYRVNMKQSMSSQKKWENDFRTYEYAVDVISKANKKSILKRAKNIARNDLSFSIFIAKKQKIKIPIKDKLKHLSFTGKLVVMLTKATPRFIPKLFIQ